MVLITGASGNTGQEVLKQFIATGRPVRAAYQSRDKADQAPKGVEAVLMDYNDPASVQAACKGIERVFLVGPVAPSLAELERNATDGIKKAGVQLIVKLSAMGGNGAIFPRQHKESEDYIKSTGIQYTIVRPNGFMQNMIAYYGATIRTQNAFYGCQGDGKVSHVDVRDIAAVVVRTLTEDTHAGKGYDITGPEALTNARIAEVLSNVLGREVKYVDVPPGAVKEGMVGAGVSEWSADGVLDLTAFYKRGGASMVTGDVEHVLGRKPISFEQFAKDHASSFQPAK